MTSIITAIVRGDKRLSPEDIDRRLSVHALMTAADLHCRLGGDDDSFMQMARSSLERVRGLTNAVAVVSQR
jgi:hypothetical protein